MLTDYIYVVTTISLFIYLFGGVYVAFKSIHVISQWADLWSE